MEFGVLGPVEVVGDDHRYALGGPKQRTVMALLVANAGRQVSTDMLIDGTYGDTAPERAHRSIHTYISNLRNELGDVIERQGEGYVLKAERRQVDSLRFQDLVRSAGDEEDPVRRGEILRDALALWRGLPFADIEDHGRLAAEITRLNELRVAATEARVEADLESGLDRELLGELDSLAAEHPLHERFRAQQMLALYRAGRQAEALRAYERTRLYLVEEMGLDPSPELRVLEQRILDQDADLLLSRRPTVRPGAVVVVDIGDSAELGRMAPRERQRLLADQAAVIDRCVSDRGGRLFAHTGTAAFAWFESAENAARASIEMEGRTSDCPPRLRIAVAVGDLEVSRPEEVSGPPLSRAAALVASAHPGQVLLAADAQAAVAESGAAGLVVRSLGSHDVPGLADGELIYQLGADGNIETFPPLLTDSHRPVVPSFETGLPGYELRERVWVGASGVVHRGYQPSAGREVAVTIIYSEQANDPGFIRRFEIEAQMVSRLEHPRIVPLLDYWREPDAAYLVSRWMHGGTLAERSEESLLSVDEMSAVIDAIGGALGYSHRNGVAHGNLSPACVVFDGEGNPYLTGFNVAQPFDSATSAIAADVRDLAVLIDRCVRHENTIAEFLAVAAGEPGFAAIPDLVAAWRQATDLEPVDPALGFTPTRNPYKGLRSFGELDAADFFGRREETQRLLSAVAEHSLVAVVGPSGVGKSSVVRAGLLPQLRAGALPGSERWLIADMIPGPYPFEELASALMRLAVEMPADLEGELRSGPRGLVRAVKRYLPQHATLVLLIDQFEELFTLVNDKEDRDQLLEVLRTAVLDERSSIRIVITMRADFYDRPLGLGTFGDLVGAATVPLPAPSVDGLREMIEMPAAAVGVPFESGLVERIASDVEDQPGALPLLEFSLTELFDQRTADVLTMAGYRDSGGVLGALGRRAEAIFSELTSEAKEAAQEIFLRLVKVAEAGRDTRRRVRQTELAQLGIGSGAVEEVLRSFGDDRLLTFDRDPITRGPTVEVAHEAILSEWPRLTEWIETQREDLLLRGRLAVAAAEWESSGRSDEYLLTGGRLTQHEEWTANTDLALSVGERKLLSASRQAEDERRAARRRTRSRVLAALSVTAVLAVALAVLAVSARQEAAHQAYLVEVRQLASVAQLEIEEDPERAVLLAMEAVEAAKGEPDLLREATDALRAALVEDRLVRRYDIGATPISLDLDVDKTGQTFLTPIGGSIGLVSVEGGEVIRAFEGPDGSQPVRGLFVGDGSIVMGNFETPGGVLVRGWAVDDLSTALYEFEGAFEWADAAGGYLILKVCEPESSACVVEVRDSSNGGFLYGHPAERGQVAVDDEGTLMVSFSSQQLGAEIVALDTGIVQAAFGVPFAPQYAAFSPSGDRIAITATNESKVAVVDTATGEILMSRAVDRTWTLAWNADGSELMVGGNSAAVYVMDATTGNIRLQLQGHAGTLAGIASVPGSDSILSGPDENGQIIRWDSSIGPVAGGLSIATGLDPIRGLAYLDEGQIVAWSLQGARLFDAKGGLEREFSEVQEDYPFIRVTVQHNRYLDTVTSDGRGVLIDLETGFPSYIAPEGYQVVDVTSDLSTVLLATYQPDSIPSDPRLVDVATGEVIAEFNPGFSYGVCLGAISPDGELVWLWDCDSEGAFFRADGGEIENMRYRGKGAVFSPDGETLVYFDNDSNIEFIDLNAARSGASMTEALIREIQGHDAFVTSASFNADGSLLATAARLEPVRVWDTLTGRLVAEIPLTLMPGFRVTPHVALHPTLPLAIVPSAGGEIIEYALDPDELLDTAAKRVTRSLTEAECQTFLHRETCPDVSIAGP